MGKTAPGSEPRELIPAKKYAAVVCGVYELGTIRGNYGPQKQWIAMFSLHGRKKGQPIRDAKGEIQTISAFLNFYLGSPSKPSDLLKLFSAVNGNRTYTAEEIKSGSLFDMETLIDKTCEINVIHKANTAGTMRAQIDGFFALDPEEDTIPEPALNSFYWEIPTSGWDGTIPDGADQVPKFVRSFIEKSDEYKAARQGRGNGNGTQQTVGAGVSAGDDEDSGEDDDKDIPF